ncbi:hypothetical protein GCM10027416_19110 [Okibacterium endophyticum]
MKRLGGGIAAVGLALGGVAISSAPAMAAPAPEATIAVADTTFTAGSWGDGIEVTGEGFPADTDVRVYLGAQGENGGGEIAGVDVTTDADGNLVATIVPDASNPPVSPDENGFPVYAVNYSYQDGEGEYVFGEGVELTILPGTAITGPAEVDPQALKDGVEAQIVGFGDDSTVSVSLEILDPDTNEWTVLSTTNQPVVDGAGAVSVTASYTDGSLIEAGRSFRVVVTGDTSGAVATWYFVTAGAVAPTPVDPAPVDPAPTAPVDGGTTPVLAETGANDQGLLVGGGLALFVLAAGAAALMVARRKAALES